MTGTDVQNNLSGNADGGGISATGDVTVTTSNFAFNVASVSGGGISTSSGVLTLMASNFTGNSANSDGGAIVSGGRLVVDEGAEFHEDDAASRGAGIFNSGGGPNSITNSTIYENTATSKGGGVYNYEDLNVTNTTFSGNAAPTGGAFYSNPYQHENDEFRVAVVSLKNTILANSTSGGDCFNYQSGTLVPITGLRNLIEADNTFSPCGTTGAINKTDPKLGTLAGFPLPQYYPCSQGRLPSMPATTPRARLPL